MKQIEDEAFLLKNDWKKEKGLKIDLEQMRDCPDEWEHLYIIKEDEREFVKECEFWTHKDIEEVYEDKDNLLELHYEEYLDENGDLYDEPINILESADNKLNTHLKENK